jgi:hypothetical protein
LLAPVADRALDALDESRIHLLKPLARPAEHRLGLQSDRFKSDGDPRSISDI